MATEGRPLAIASISTQPKVSWVLGSTNRSASLIIRATSSLGTWPWNVTGGVRRQRLELAPQLAVAHHVEPDVVEPLQRLEEVGLALLLGQVAHVEQPPRRVAAVLARP